MHWRSRGSQNVVPFNPEIELTARKHCGEARRKRAVVETAGQDQRVLRDYAKPQSSGIASFIVSPTIKTHNFEHRPTLISLVEKDQFGGHPSKNPNVQLCNFLAKCDTINSDGVSTDAIRLRLFPFSLKDRASEWLQNEEPNSFTMWETLSKVVLSKYFPPKKIVKLRTNITSLAQRDRKSLHEAWESFKGLQHQRSHHSVPDWILIQTFYNGLKQSVKIFVDATTGGAFTGKSIEAAKTLLEEMAPNN